MTGFRIGAALAAALACGAAAIGAGAEAPVRAGVLPGWREGAVHHAAIVLEVAPGWHTYWRAPGERGLAPRLALAPAATIRWPAPEAIESFGRPVLGHRGTVVLPIEVEAAGGGPVALRGRLDLGVCREVCVPATVSLAADLSPGGAPDARIEAARAAGPASPDEAGVAGWRCAWAAGPDGPRLRVAIEGLAPGAPEAAMIEWGRPPRAARDASTRREGRALVVEGTLAGAAAVARDEVTVTVAGGGGAVTLEGCPPG